MFCIKRLKCDHHWKYNLYEWLVCLYVYVFHHGDDKNCKIINTSLSILTFVMHYYWSSYIVFFFHSRSDGLCWNLRGGEWRRSAKMWKVPWNTVQNSRGRYELCERKWCHLGRCQAAIRNRGILQEYTISVQYFSYY